MVKVIIKPENVIFDSSENQNIIDAAIVNNINVSYGCKNGLCGACKCKVISGDFRLKDYNRKVLTDEEFGHGYTLLCKTFPQSDMELYIPELLSGYPVKILPAKVSKIEKHGNIAIIKMKTPHTQNFKFYSGQYIEIILLEKHRSYSIANVCVDSGDIEIHVKYHDGGVFSEYVWNELKENNIIRFKGPLGNFRLSETKNDLVFVCTGTGFAPIKAMLESCVKNKDARNIRLYWGNREEKDFYLLSELYLLAENLNINITLCLSQENKPNFSKGYVTQYIKHDFSEMDGCEVYACGNLKMIEDVYELCSNELKLDKSRFYSDAFTPSV